MTGGAGLDPAFGRDLGSLDSYLAILTATLIAVFVPAGMSVLYHRRQHRPLPHHLHALPGGLLIAAACVLISRVADFQPGYLYGVVATVAFTGELARDQKCRVATLTSVTALTLALLAWFVWVPLSTRGARAGASQRLVLADDLLASMVVGGLVGCVITLLPLQFLPGWTIRAWSRRVWLALFGLASSPSETGWCWPTRQGSTTARPRSWSRWRCSSSSAMCRSRCARSPSYVIARPGPSWRAGGLGFVSWPRRFPKPSPRRR